MVREQIAEITSTSLSGRNSNFIINLTLFIRGRVNKYISCVSNVYNKHETVMKRIILLFALFVGIACGSYAQKFALIDMEYILKNISSYETAQEQIEVMSQKWQAEVEKAQQDIKSMYKSYQSDLVFLSADQKTKRENEIVEKERSLQELNRTYFGPEGELFKKREALIKPIQDEIYNAIKEIADVKGYQLVIDRSSAENVIFASPRIDISNEVLAKLGYSK